VAGVASRPYPPRVPPRAPPGDDLEVNGRSRGGAVRLLSLAVPVALIAVVLDTLVNPSERIGQLTTLTTLLFVAAAAPAVHLEIVAWRRPRGDPRRVWS